MFIYCDVCRLRVYPYEPQILDDGKIVHQDCVAVRKKRRDDLRALLIRLATPVEFRERPPKKRPP